MKETIKNFNELIEIVIEFLFQLSYLERKYTKWNFYLGEYKAAFCAD